MSQFRKIFDLKTIEVFFNVPGDAHLGCLDPGFPCRNPPSVSLTFRNVVIYKDYIDWIINIQRSKMKTFFSKVLIPCHSNYPSKRWH